MDTANPELVDATAWLDDPAEWQQVAPDSEGAADLRDRLFGAYAAAMAAAGLHPVLAFRTCASHPGMMILRVRLGSAAPVFALMGPLVLRYLEGSELDLYNVNLRQRPDLAHDDAAARAYLRLFLDISRGAHGWCLVERPSDLAIAGDAWTAVREAIAPHLREMTIAPADAHGRRKCAATVQRAGRLLRRALVLWSDGLVQTRAEEELCAVPALAEPAPFQPFAALLSGPLAGLAAADGDEAQRTLRGTLDWKPAASDGATAPQRQIADVFRLLAAALLTEAVKAGFRPRGPRGQDLARALTEYLKAYRPTIAIETPYRELRQDFAELIADSCGLPLDLDWQAAPEAVARRMTVGSSPSVVLLTEHTFGFQPDGSERDAGLVLAPIVHGPHIGLFVVERVAALQQNARDMIDLRLSIPRIGEAQFWSCVRALFGPRARRRAGTQEWVRYVLPRDIARAATATEDFRQFLNEVEQTVRRRLAQYTNPSGPALKDLHGMGMARFRMEELAADIASALKGETGWDQVDRGYLLVGPPGTGKTTLVRALARECGVRFVLASASAWQEGGSLGPHIQNIRRSFREARLYAPAILFIDEIDSIGRRGRIEANNSQYQTVVINTLLEELQGFEGREGVIVIGATNNPEDVDPALRRPGRLDRIVEVGYPNVAALAEIYTYYLDKAARDGFASVNVDVQHLARMTFGRTGSHVELYVRGAIRRARRAGRRTLSAADLQAEITDRPPEGLQLRLADGVMRRVAVHEAGHALVTLTGAGDQTTLSWVSITPRANGSLGFVARSPDEAVFSTLAEMEESVRITLAGRAAEELVFGRDALTTGAGGGSNSDLAVASRLVLRMLTQFGFSQSSGLLWLDWRDDDRPNEMTAEAIRNLPMGNEILHEARETLERLYAEALDRLRCHRAALDRITELLIAQQDVAPDEVLGALAEPPA